MSKLALNFFLDEGCTDRKVGFQLPDTSNQTAIKDSMALVEAWKTSGLIKDGSVIRIYARVTEVKDRKNLTVPEIYVDGKKVKVPAQAAAPADEEIPF